MFKRNKILIWILFSIILTAYGCSKSIDEPEEIIEITVPPAILSPEYDEVVQNIMPTFEWTKSAENQEKIVYEISVDDTINKIVNATNKFRFQQGFEAGIHSWKVRAKTVNGQWTNYCEPVRFKYYSKNDYVFSDEKGAIDLNDPFLFPCWNSDSFEGTFQRIAALDGSMYVVYLNAKQGGFDTAITYYFPAQITVDEIPSDAKLHMKIMVDVAIGENARWWAGPKLDIRKAWNPTEGWQETYVVENASKTPEEMHQLKLDWIEDKGGAYLGETLQDGAKYKHYRCVHNEWVQYWAIRQEWRESGEVSIKPILEKWRESGMPNYNIKNIRANIETAREMAGQITISEIKVKGL